MKAIVLLSLLLLAQPARAILYNYIYTGDNYTESTLPNEPGFRLSDHLIINMKVDDSLWGMGQVTGFLDYDMVSGPFHAADSARVAFASNGDVLSWVFSGALPGVDIVSGSNPGEDLIFIAREFPLIGSARVQYPEGAPRDWKFFPAVPETGSSLGLLAMSILSLACFRRL
jgi:hypothetical protein